MIGRALLAAALLAAVALPAMAQTQPPLCGSTAPQAGYCVTPAGMLAIASTDQAEVCRVEMGIDPRDGHYGRLSYSVRNRMPEEQSGAIKRAWLPPGHRLGEYELDHIVSLALGGSNDKSNLQMQPIEEAKRKDELEVFLWRSVCFYHTILLPDAQAMLMSDWKASYLTAFGRWP